MERMNKTSDTKKYFREYRQEHIDEYRQRDQHQYWTRRLKAVDVDIKNVNVEGLDKTEVVLLYKFIVTKKTIEKTNVLLLDRAI
jgi:hypothetical protein